jgi:type IV pilus assembly protein PilB
MALLGEILIEKGIITKHQLDLALTEQKRTGELLGQILFDLGFISEDALADAIAKDDSVQRVKLRDLQVNPDVLELVPIEFCKEKKVLPIAKDDYILTVAMVDTYDIYTVDAIERRTGYQVKPVEANESDLIMAIDQYYSTEGEVEEIIQQGMRFADEARRQIDKVGPTGAEDLAEQAPIIRLIDKLITQAVAERATDIHIVPDEKLIRVLYRIDGILHPRQTPPLKLRDAIISRIKIMANLNIAEKRVPQDGAVTFPLGRRKIDLRVSVFPTVKGENIVMRILDKATLTLGLEKLGFTEVQRIEFERLLNLPYGIILVTGPTGSGKTTTLYSALASINAVEKNVHTIEDPVEYTLPVIRQSEINVKAGFTFALGLRSLLRQDPDVILVGEIRDTETVQMAVRSALTGHLVLSTLHTNDAAGAIPRIMDMGVEPFLVASSILAILAQRLVRIICPNCKEPYEPSTEELDVLGLDEMGRKKREIGLDTLDHFVTDQESIQRKSKHFMLYKGKGCSFCNGTGYKGRFGIFELITMNAALCDLAEKKASIDQIRNTARKMGMSSMYDAGMEKVRLGMTTIDEVKRVTLMSEVFI